MRVVINQEQEAFNAFLSSDEKGFDYFFHKYYSPLVLYATKIVSNHEVARDICSDSFIKLWNNKESITEYRKVRFFLYRIVFNASVDHLRMQKTGLRAIADIKSTMTAFDNNTILENLIETETYHRLYQSLTRLPARCRQVFQMFYFQDKAIKEISEELGISVNTVKSQKQRAIQLLKASHAFILIIVVFLETVFHA